MVFYSFTGSTVCSLQQQAHYVLVCFWFGILALAFIEVCLAQLRNLDRSPRHLRVLYVSWLTLTLASYAFIMSRPYASIHDQEDAGVLLVLHVARFDAVIWLAIELNIELLKNFAHLIARVSSSYSMASTTTSSSLTQPNGSPPPTPGSTLGTPDDNHHTVVTSAAVRLHNIVASVFRPLGVIHGTVHVIFLVVVPLSLGVTQTPLPFLEIFLSVVWATHSIVSVLQSITLVYVTLRLRNIIRWLTTHVFIPQFVELSLHSKESKDSKADSTNGDHTSSNGHHAPGSNGHANPSARALSPQIEQGIQEMNEVENRMRSGTITNVFIVFINLPIFATAAVIGMQWWYDYYRDDCLLFFFFTPFSFLPGCGMWLPARRSLSRSRSSSTTVPIL